MLFNLEAVNTSRLTPNDNFTIYTNLNSSSSPTSSLNVHVTYDEGSTYGIGQIGKYPISFKSPVISESQYDRIFSFIIPISILVTIAYSVPFISRLLRKLTDKISQGRDAIGIQKEIISIKKQLSDKDFDNAISIRRWDVLSQKHKHQIFYKFNDFNSIEKFYAEVKKRDSYFFNQQLTIDTLRIYNNECFNLAVTYINH